MFETANGFFFDLTYTFASEVEGFTYFFEGHCVLVGKTEIQTNYIGFARGKCFERALYLGAQRI